MTSQSSTVAASPEVTFTPRQMLWRVAKKYPFKIVASIVTGFSGALFNGVGTALVIPIMLSLLGQDAILREGPPIFQALLAPFEDLPETYRYVAMALAALLLMILKNASNYLSALASGTLSRAMTSDLQRQGLNMILSVDLEYFSKAQVGELVNRLGGRDEPSRQRHRRHHSTLYYYRYYLCLSGLAAIDFLATHPCGHRFIACIEPGQSVFW